MFKEVFGNESAGRVLAYLYFASEANPSSIAGHFGTALDPVIRQLERFTRARVLEKRASYGRAKIYSFRKQSRLAPLVLKVVEALVEDLPKSEKARLKRVGGRHERRRH